MALAYEDKVPASYRTAFIQKVKEISARLGINPDWLMVVMRFESAGTFSPSVTNSGSGAVGLIQFTETGIKDLGGVKLAELKAMTAVQQLDYVEKYLTRYKAKFKNLYDVYLAVFSPAYLGRPDAQVVYSKSDTTAIGKRRYELNKVLDTNQDGNITIWEIKQVISKYIPATVDAGSTTTKTTILPILAIAFLTFLFFNRA